MPYYLSGTAVSFSVDGNVFRYKMQVLFRDRNKVGFAVTEG